MDFNGRSAKTLPHNFGILKVFQEVHQLSPSHRARRLHRALHTAARRLFGGLRMPDSELW